MHRLILAATLVFPLAAHAGTLTLTAVTTGGTSTNRGCINTDGGTTWTALTTAG